MTKRRVDWFRVAVILALAAAVIWVAIVLGRSPIGWMIPSARADTLNVTWTAPTGNCNNTPLTDLRGYRVRWGSGSIDLPATATAFDIPNVAPGTWWVNVAAFNSTGQESQYVAAWKTVTPDKFVTKATTVYTFVRAEGKILTLPTLHTVPLGTQCDATQSVNGKYVVPREAVTWSGSARLVAVLADCG